MHRHSTAPKNRLRLALYGSLLLSASAAYAATHGPRPRSKHALPPTLSAADKLNLTLSRFTFGPRPGERDEVARIGLERWFTEQLSPDTLGDSALEARLDRYPALRLSLPQLAEQYPAPELIRRAANTGTLPANPVARVSLERQVAFYQLRQDTKADKQAAQNASQLGPISPSATIAVTQATNTAPSAEDVPAPSPSELATVLAMPPGARYSTLQALPPARFLAMRKAAGETRLTAGMSPLQTETLTALGNPNHMLLTELDNARLLRDIYSQREVEAVMTDFWLNHFSVNAHKDQREISLLPDLERTVRAHALGRFEDLLVAVAESPAMQLYLDNAQSIGPNSVAATRQRMNSARANTAPTSVPATATKTKLSPGLNENYARELMELHTLGVTGGYTQHDVTEVARVFTGWTLDRPESGQQFTFNPNRHDPGDKLVLGQTIAGASGTAGQTEGLQVLHLLATSPATAHFLSTKLAERFVSDTPPPALVDRLAASYLASGGGVRFVLLTLFHSPEFNSPATLHAKLKTPLEYVVSAARASGAEVSNPAPLAHALDTLGMPLYGAQQPSGYKWDEATWLNSGALVARMNFALSFSSNHLAGTRVAWDQLLAQSNSTLPAPTLQPASFPTAAQAPEQESQLEQLLLGSPASAQTHSIVLAQAAAANAQPTAAPTSSAPSPAQTTGTIAGLLLGSPEFQRR